MASVYKRGDSPYWWIRQKNSAGKWIGRSTKYRHNNAVETNRARHEAAQISADEVGAASSSASEKWAQWVPSFFATHCEHAPTRNGYLQSWRWVHAFLLDRGVFTPAQLSYSDAFAYIGWRCGLEGGEAQKSTALRDLKVLRLVMRHAVRTNMAKGNPCDRMGVKRQAPKAKVELCDEDIALIYQNLLNTEPWLGLAFSICLHTGCRVSDANLDRMGIDFERRTITFNNPKGGEEKAFTTILSADLRDIIEKALAAHDRATLVPPEAKHASQRFGRFFDSIGLDHVSIHCTRVTFISRLARSGVPERIARLAVNHASEAVHRTYQRLRIDDLRQIEGAVKFPKQVTASAAETQTSATAALS